MDFGTILIVIVLVGVVAACVSYIGSGEIYSGLGRTGMSLHEPDMRPGPAPGSAAADSEAQEEIRQMVEAKSARSQARGGPALDVDAEIDALTGAPAQADAALTEEIRQLVVARNGRRMRRDEAPLDIEAEVQRELRRLSG